MLRPRGSVTTLVIAPVALLRTSHTDIGKAAPKAQSSGQKDGGKKAKRSMYAARSETKMSKRHQLIYAMEMDRARARELEPQSMMQTLKEFPYKWFFAFMLFWSWLGYAFVPFLKSWREGERPRYVNAPKGSVPSVTPLSVMRSKNERAMIEQEGEEDDD